MASLYPQVSGRAVRWLPLCHVPNEAIPFLPAGTFPGSQKQQSVDAFVDYFLTILTRDYGIPQTVELELGIQFIFEGSLGVMEKRFLSDHPIDSAVLTAFFANTTRLIVNGFQINKNTTI